MPFLSLAGSRAPPFLRNVSGLETIYRDYASKGVQFYFVYKTLAHPENDGYLNLLTLTERLMHIQEAKRTFKGATLPWLCDNMANDLKKALGGLNNPEFISDPEGKIVRQSETGVLRRNDELTWRNLSVQSPCRRRLRASISRLSPHVVLRRVASFRASKFPRSCNLFGRLRKRKENIPTTPN